MTLSNIACACVTIAALSPLVCNASPSKAAVRACASAFAEKLAAPGAAVPGYKLDYRAVGRSAFDDFYATETTFILEARTAKSGATLARAECATDSHGVVTSLSSLPLVNKVAAR